MFTQILWHHRYFHGLGIYVADCNIAGVRSKFMVVDDFGNLIEV